MSRVPLSERPLYLDFFIEITKPLRIGDAIPLTLSFPASDELADLYAAVWAPRRRQLAEDADFWRDAADFERDTAPVTVAMRTVTPAHEAKATVMVGRSKPPADLIILSSEHASGALLLCATYHMQKERARASTGRPTILNIRDERDSPVTWPAVSALPPMGECIAAFETRIQELRCSPLTTIDGVGKCRALRLSLRQEPPEWPPWDPRWRDDRNSTS